MYKSNKKKLFIKRALDTVDKAKINNARFKSRSQIEPKKAKEDGQSEYQNIVYCTINIS